MGWAGRPAWVTTSGPIHLRVTKWGSPHPIFDFGDATAIHVGTRDGGLPVWQEGPGRVANVQHETRLADDEVATLDLPAGRYWLVTTNYAELEAFACQHDALSEATPAPVPTPKSEVETQDVAPPSTHRTTDAQERPASPSPGSESHEHVTASTAPPFSTPGTAPTPPRAPSPSPALVNGQAGEIEPVRLTGDSAQLEVGGFAPNSRVSLGPAGSLANIGALTADAHGVVQMNIDAGQFPPGVTSLTFVGDTRRGRRIVARHVRIRVPGTPTGSVYSTWLCCMAGGDEPTRVQITWLGVRMRTADTDRLGGVLVEVPLFDLPEGIEGVIRVEDIETGEVLEEVVNSAPARRTAATSREPRR